jgi:hypothetical protein
MYIRTLIPLLFLTILITDCKKEKSPSPFDPTPVTGVKRVWAVDDGEKIKREDINNPLASDINNVVWKDSTINIFGARNEIVAFQLIIQSEKDGAEKVNVVISNLYNGTTVIPGSATGPTDPFDYRGRYVELFTEHYLNITKRTPPNLWHFSGSAAPSAYYTGWIPDCLIPFSAPSGKGGAPFSIPGNSNQGIWVDIYIPKDASEGNYTGNAQVNISGKLILTIPIHLKIYDFILSDSTHIKNMFGLLPWDLARRHGINYGSSTYYQIEAKYHQLAHRHRFNLVREVSNLNDMAAYHRRYLTGELYTTGYGYAGPGENIGNNTFSIGYGGSFPDEYGGSVANMNNTDWWSGSDAWTNWLQSNAPGVEYHKYLFPDEPDWKGPAGALGTGSMDTIRMQADWTHSNPGIGRTIPCLVTNTIKPELKGYVDFWSVSSQEVTNNTSEEEVAFEKAQGHKYGIYNGWRPGMGAVVTDGDAVEFRVMPWIVWKYNIDQYFYWGVNYWTNINVFSNPLTYNDQVNGDGTFLYPGVDYLFYKESRGLSGPLSSIRAKNWRRGAQDYEYFWLAKQAGLENEMKSIVDNCVPTALWEAKSQSNISWSSRGYKFEEYRKQLAELLSFNSAKNK